MAGRSPAGVVREREDEEPCELGADRARQPLIAAGSLVFVRVQELAVREEKLVAA